LLALAIHVRRIIAIVAPAGKTPPEVLAVHAVALVQAFVAWTVFRQKFGEIRENPAAQALTLDTVPLVAIEVRVPKLVTFGCAAVESVIA